MLTSKIRTVTFIRGTKDDVRKAYEEKFRSVGQGGLMRGSPDSGAIGEIFNESATVIGDEVLMMITHSEWR